MMKYKTYIAWLMLWGIHLLGTALYACPECKEVYAAGTKEAAIGESYSWSVLFMLGMFFTMLIGGAFFMKRQIQKHAGLKAAQI